MKELPDKYPYIAYSTDYRDYILVFTAPSRDLLEVYHVVAYSLTYDRWGYYPIIRFCNIEYSKIQLNTVKYCKQNSIKFYKI